MESINRTNDRPQRQDIGMCDVLAISGGSTVEAPTLVRITHDNPTGTTANAQAAQARRYSALLNAHPILRRTICGYIYLIRCLRL